MKVKKLLFVYLLFALMAGNAKAQTNAPFLTQGFENGMADWSVRGYGNVFSGYAYNGSCSFRMAISSGEYSYLISPELGSSDTENGVSVSFYYSSRFAASSAEFKVGYSMTTADPVAFTWSDLVFAENGIWIAYEKSLPANVKYIAIASVRGYIYIDDVVLRATDYAIPSVPTVSDVTSHSVTVGWTGTAQSLRCCSMQEYGFESENDWGGWSKLGGERLWWSGASSISGHKSNYCVLSDVITMGQDNYLVSPSMSLGGCVMFYAKAVNSNNTWKGGQRDNDFQLNFKVMVTTKENPVVGDFVVVADTVFEASTIGWMKYTIDLSAYSGQGHVAICHTYNEGTKGEMDNGGVYWLAIDDITLYATVKEAHELAGNSYTIDELNEMTKYAIQLRGADQWSDPLFVATLPEGGIDTYVFVRDGYWNDITNWENWYMPQSEDDNVVIGAHARIPANYVAKAGTITLLTDGATYYPLYYGSITIAEGGQLRHSNSDVRVTMEKNIIGYTGERDNYKLLAFPTVAGIVVYNDNYLHDFVNNMPFDLYEFDQSQDLEWINYEQSSGSHPFRYIQNGVGYLYANEEGGRFRFNFTSLMPSNNNRTVTKTLAYTSGKDFSGWNLLGNPFACNAYVLDGNGDYRAFWRLQEVEGESKIVLADNNVIAPLEGIFVVANASGESVSFTAEEPAGKSMNMMDFTLRKAFMRSDACLDRTRVRIGEGQNMGHLDLMVDPNRLYIPMDGKAMSVVNTQPMGELPLNFEAASNGTFVIGFTNKAEGLSYCHLIDNLTGADIDLLQQSEYTFEAKSNDYASRFRVVFVAKDADEGIIEDSETFAFNSNGSWIIVNEDHAILQVIDVQGRMLSSETIEGCVSKNIQTAPGVYVLRLINGENVSVQKVFVR